MEYLCLEEDEIYETQCGEMFFTTKGRLVFHCTLCNKKFNGFDFYEMHVKEHIPILFEDEPMSSKNTVNNSSSKFLDNDHKKTASTHNFESDDDNRNDYFNHQESNFGEIVSNDSELEESLYSIKIESSAEEIASTSEKSLISAIKKEKYMFKNESTDTDDKNYAKKIAPTRKKMEACKLGTHKVTQKLESVPSDQILSTEGSEIANQTKTCKRFSLQLENEIAEYKKKYDKTSSNQDAKNIPDNNVEIPKVVRAVRPRFSQRSMLTPDDERKHKCPVCEAAFKDRHNMIHHLKRHSDNKDHKCPECDKRFFTTSEVNVHLKSHKGDRPFLCNVCGKSFAYNNQMLTHFKRHTNQKQHSCDICGKAFFDSYLLKRHMVSHGTERPFSCVICLASFARKRTLINHIKLHQNKREYKCELCDSRFNQRAGVISHMRTAHKEAKIKC